MRAQTSGARRQEILALLAQRGEVTVEQLARRFAIDRVTVRRDLARLEREGLVRRTHGGAIRSRGGTVEFAVQRKASAHAAAKRAIARAAAGIVRPGMVISLDTGTTTLEVARAIAGVPDLKVLTSSLLIASVLHTRENLEVVLLGGVVRKGSPDLIGTLTEENLRRFRVDLCILGADAVGPGGLFTADAGVSGVSRAMIDGAQQVVLVADSSKFAAHAFVRFAEWEDIDEVFTDDDIARSDLHWLRKVVGKVTCASVTRE
jgi:DeoR/GlpR family transcriptional regulator of sugar metabolism